LKIYPQFIYSAWGVGFELGLFKFNLLKSRVVIGAVVFKLGKLSEGRFNGGRLNGGNVELKDVDGNVKLGVVVEFVVVKLGKFRDGSERGGKVGTEIGGRPALGEAAGNPEESCGTTGAADAVGSPPSEGIAPRVGRVGLVRLGIAGRPAVDTDGKAPVVGSAPSVGIAGTAPPGTYVVAEGMLVLTFGTAGEATVGVRPVVVAAGTATEAVGVGLGACWPETISSTGIL